MSFTNDEDGDGLAALFGGITPQATPDAEPEPRRAAEPGPRRAAAEPAPPEPSPYGAPSGQYPGLNPQPPAGPPPASPAYELPAPAPQQAPPSWEVPAPAPQAPPSYEMPAPAPQAPPSWEMPAPATQAPPSWEMPAPAQQAPPSYETPSPAPRAPQAYDLPAPAAPAASPAYPGLEATHRDPGASPYPGATPTPQAAQQPAYPGLAPAAPVPPGPAYPPTAQYPAGIDPTAAAPAAPVPYEPPPSSYQPPAYQPPAYQPEPSFPAQAAVPPPSSPAGYEPPVTGAPPSYSGPPASAPSPAAPEPIVEPPAFGGFESLGLAPEASDGVRPPESTPVRESPEERSFAEHPVVRSEPAPVATVFPPGPLLPTSTAAVETPDDLERSTVGEKIGLGIALFTGPIGLGVAIVNAVRGARRRGWLIGVVRASLVLGVVSTILTGIAGYALWNIRLDQLQHAEIAAASAEFCAAGAADPALVTAPTLGWPRPGATTTESLALMQAWTDNWVALAAGSPAELRAGMELLAARGQAIVDAVTASRSVDDDANIAQITSIEQQSGVAGWYANYCVEP